MSPRIGGASARFVCWHYTTYCFNGNVLSRRKYVTNHQNSLSFLSYTKKLRVIVDHMLHFWIISCKKLEGKNVDEIATNYVGGRKII